MDINYDTEDWLGRPTPLEMYKQQCALLENEIASVDRRLKSARANIAGLIQMNDVLATGKAEVEVSLKKALAEITKQHEEASELGGQVRSLKLVASQRDYLLTENQRILLELSVLMGPQP